MTQEESIIQDQVRQATGNSLLPQTSAAVFRQQLAVYIHTLINANFDKLVSMLYLLDVNEQKLKALLANKATQDAGLLIADAIIERQLQKIHSRKQYRDTNSNIPDEEKW